MNAAQQHVTPSIPSRNRHQPPISNRNSNRPSPRVTPTKQTTGHPVRTNSNRESLRLEINVTPTKQTPDPDSNREKEARFSPPVGEGVYLPPGLGLGVVWDLRGMRGAPDIQNSNRECVRLEIAVNLRKQRTPITPNRELEALLPAPPPPPETPRRKHSHHRRTTEDDDGNRSVLESAP
jgi:hypothetical protein